MKRRKRIEAKMKIMMGILTKLRRERRRIYNGEKKKRKREIMMTVIMKKRRTANKLKRIEMKPTKTMIN